MTDPTQPSGPTPRPVSGRGERAPEPSADLPPRLLGRLIANPMWLIAVGAATIVGAVAAVAAVVLPRPAAHDSPAVTAQPQPTQDTPASQPTGAATITAGTCVDTGHSIVPCTSAHRYEVIGSHGSCTRHAAVAFLGGRVELDVALVTPVVTLVDGDKACVISDPRQPAFGSARGVMWTQDGGRWRRCLDARITNEVVACTVPHTGEFFDADGNRAPDATACSAAAQVYMGVSLDRVSSRLSVAVIPALQPDDEPHCLVRVLGNDVLTDTVRSIGVRALPLRAAE